LPECRRAGGERERAPNAEQRAFDRQEAGRKRRHRPRGTGSKPRQGEAGARRGAGCEALRLTRRQQRHGEYHQQEFEVDHILL
jgi:hypothetical protein